MFKSVILIYCIKRYKIICIITIVIKFLINCSRLSQAHEKCPSSSGLSQTAQNNLITPSSPFPLDRTRAMKLSGIANYHNPLFDPTNNLMPPALFNSEGRISSWPWFCMNDVNSSAAVSSTAANLLYNKSNEHKKELKNTTDSSSFESNQQNSPFSSPSNIESDDMKICNVSNSTKKLDTYDKGSEKINSLPCSPNGNISSISSPPLEDNDSQSIHQDNSSSTSGSPFYMKMSQVLVLKLSDI